MVKDFLDVFSDLDLSAEEQEMMSHARVTKITMNLRRDRMRIHLEADRLLEKAAVYRIERAIENQIFENGGVKAQIIERFCLSGQYTARNLMPLYEESMLLELKEISMPLYDMFRRCEKTFTDEDTLILRMQDNCISEERERELRAYLEKVFCERCGQNLKLEMKFEDMPESSNRELLEKKVEQEVAAISRRAFRKKEDDSDYLEAPQKKSAPGAGAGKTQADRQDNRPAGTGKESEKKTVSLREGSGKKSDRNAKGSDAASAGRRGGTFGAGTDSRGALRRSDNPDVLIGRDFEDDAIPLEQIQEEMG